MQLRHRIAIGLFLGISSIPVTAQNVNQYNYKQYSTCVEVFMNGKTYSSFGEGPCPPGTKNVRRPLDPNQQKMAQTQASVNALGAMQQQVLAFGNAMFQKRREEAIKILNTYSMILPASEVSADKEKYKPTTKIFPEVGSMAVAEVGTPLIQDQSGFYSDCLVSTEDRERVYTGFIHALKAGELSCKIFPKNRGFFPTYFNYYRDAEKTDDKFVYEQFLEFDKGLYAICLRDMGIKFGCHKEMPETSVQTFTGFVGTLGSERPIVTYQGVKDGLLVFAYNPPEAPAGTVPTEISVNPNETRNVTFGSIKFEIMEWSDKAIVAKVQ